MKRTKIEQLFENYSFWRHLSEEEKKMLQEQIRWCTYEEGADGHGHRKRLSGDFSGM